MLAKCPPCKYWLNVRWLSVRWLNVRWLSVRWLNVRWLNVSDSLAIYLPISRRFTFIKFSSEHIFDISQGTINIRRVIVSCDLFHIHDTECLMSHVHTHFPPIFHSYHTEHAFTFSLVFTLSLVQS